MLDPTDRLIIEALQANSRITMKELGAHVHLTGQATATRVKKLEDLGIIEGYTIRVNEDKLGLPVHAMITIFTSSTFHDPYLLFLEEHRPYVRNNYKVSGDGCYVLECRFPSNQELNAFLDGLSKYVNYKLSIVIDR
ncbi:Lrp/AsnC family transcriptional regulator [Exiguobacterium sp. TNDT2]|uniref:Lrp/AsnC family transcriptional regulator n=1 Tax=Exiguobacterium sp. TNDT2 TaxID=2233531 RepID=UPI000DEFA8CE|nr:Lrp/AsnC family transcriptional regulator [Exiguobacterium sp. TNDT2]